MKALASVVLVLAVCASAVIPSSAAGDKTLENVRGTVSLDQGPNSPSQPVAVNASVAISDNQFAVTGGLVNNIPSQGAIVLPDSTRILVGQNTRVQMKTFDQQPNLTTASFVVANASTGGTGGRIRFKVEHPGGAKANYTFQTSTGQIAVRGTEGDIWAPQQNALQVNVYQVTDPALPVEVTLNDGKVYRLSAGQTLTVGITGALVAAGSAASTSSSSASSSSSSSSSTSSVSSTTQTSMSNFSEFGAASNSAAVAGAAASAAAASAGGIPAVAAVAAGVAAIGGVVIGTTGHSSPEPSSSPTTAPPGSVVVSPTALSFTAGTGPLTFHASQSNFSGTFHAAIDIGSIAAVTASSTTGDFTVTPKTNGSTTITVTGGSGKTAPVGVSVQATTIVVPGSLPTFTSLNQAQNFSAQETYYTGGFSAKSNDATVAKVTSPGSSSSGSGSFTVTSVGNGSTTITVSDRLGHSSPVGITVNGPTPTPAPTPTSIPICIGMPVSGGRAQGNHHRMDPAMAVAPGRPNPAATPTCPPTPMAGPPIAKPIAPPVVRAPQPHPIGPQPPTVLPPHVPGMPTPPPMPGGPP